MSFADPGGVINRLADIENELATVQNRLESEGMDWFRFRRDREKVGAEAFAKAKGTDGQRRRAEIKAMAEAGTEDREGWEVEGGYELLNRVSKVLDTRASIGMAILKAQGRV